MSLSKLTKVTDKGVYFQSHLDGSMHKLTPENIIDIQRVIGSDIMMMLDVCPAGAITVAGDHVAIDPAVCGGCGMCGAVCPSGAAQTAFPPIDGSLASLANLLHYY